MPSRNKAKEQPKEEEAPLSLEQALALSEEARVITAPQPPFSIIHTNRGACTVPGPPSNAGLRASAPPYAYEVVSCS